MRKIAMWMLPVAIAVLPLMAQEAEPSENEEQQQIEQAVEEEFFMDEEVPVNEEMLMEEEVPVNEEMLMEEEVPVEEPAWEGPVGVEPAWEEPAMEERGNRNQHQHREVQTLMSGSGGYGAFSVGYTEVNNLPALTMGLSAEWVIGHGFGLGIAGRGFTSDFTPVGEDFYALSGGYGGLIMEPIIVGWFPVHVAIPVLIGAGGMASYATTADLWNYDNLDPYFGEYAVFIVLEAGVELEFNLVKFFRFAMFGSYRWTPTLDMKPMYGLEPSEDYPVAGDALTGWSAGVRLKFGSF